MPLVVLIAALLLPAPAIGPEDRLARYERIAELNPRSAGARLAVGRELALLSRNEDAAEAFAEALTLDPMLEPARVGLARTLLASGDPSRAARIAGAGLRSDAADGGEQRALLVVLAEALGREGRPCEGLARLEKAFRRSPAARRDPSAGRVARLLRRECASHSR